MRGKLGHVRSLTKKFLAFYIKNWFFGVHFLFFEVNLHDFQWKYSVAISLFRAFYFIRNFAPLRTMELSGSGFRIKNWSLHVELRFSRVECRSPSKICSFSFFRIWSAIAQQITRDLCKYCTSFGVFIRLELDVQLYLHLPTVWGKGTKFSSVPTKIMAMDVPTYACIKFN